MLDTALSKKGGDARLARLLSVIQPVQDEFRVPMAALHQGQQWMIDVAHILDAPLHLNLTRQDLRFGPIKERVFSNNSIAISLNCKNNAAYRNGLWSFNNI